MRTITWFICLIASIVLLIHLHRGRTPQPDDPSLHTYFSETLLAKTLSEKISQNQGVLYPHTQHLAQDFDTRHSPLLHPEAKDSDAFQRSLTDTGGRGRHILISLVNPQKIRYISIQEDLSQGQNITSYLVQYHHQNQWLKLCEGTTVGEKIIHRLPPCDSIQHIRLFLTSSKNLPRVKKFALYR